MSEYKGRKIGEISNYDDSFTRDLIVATLGQFRDKISWKQRRADGSVDTVKMPFYYALTGDTQYIYDLFVDDPTLNRVQTSVMPVPSATLTLQSYKIIPDQMSNPNVAIRRIVPDDTRGYQTYYNKVFSVPMEFEFELKAMFSSESDMFRYTDSLIDSFFRFRFFSFEHKHTPISCFFHIPDSFNGQGNRTISALSGDARELITTQSITVQTRKPVFDENEETKILNDNVMKAIVNYVEAVYTNTESDTTGTVDVQWVDKKPDQKKYSKPRWTPDDPVEYED